MKESLAEVISSHASHSSPAGSECLDALDTANVIYNACLEAKAREVLAINVSKLVDVADFFVVVSGRSDRQVQGICNKVIDAMAEQGISPVSVEGFDSGQWVLIDFGDVVLHVFYEPMRAHYDLESLWIRAPHLKPVKSKRSGSIKLKLT